MLSRLPFCVCVLILWFIILSFQLNRSQTPFHKAHTDLAHIQTPGIKLLYKIISRKKGLGEESRSWRGQSVEKLLGKKRPTQQVPGCYSTAGSTLLMHTPSRGRWRGAQGGGGAACVEAAQGKPWILPHSPCDLTFLKKKLFHICSFALNI